MKNFIAVLTVLILSLTGSSAFGQNYRTLRGRVLTAVGNNPIVGAQVTGVDYNFSATTDQNGRWSVGVVDGKTITFSVSSVGYDSKRVMVSARNNDVTVKLNLRKATKGSASSDRLDQATISLNMTNVSLSELFREIQRQTGLHFVYNNTEIERYISSMLSYTVRGESVHDFLSRMFTNTPIRFELNSSDVVVIRILNAKELRTKIAGRVIDEHRKPIPFASVAIVGTTQGVSTDESGSWELRVNKDEQHTLAISCVGYEEVFYKLNANAPDSYTTTLKGSKEDIGTVVVTGYERVDRRRMTGSVASVQGKDVITPSGITIDKMLAGKLPGVQVSQNSSTPGAAPKIRIRGSSSIMGNREPVWVVDGIIMEDPVKVSAADLNSMDRINLVGNAISFLNPEDIERIDVLKDVSATAIYGVKAANGVVVITTKRGRMGPPMFSYSTNLSVKERPSYRTANLMNSSERIDVSEEIARRGLLYSGGGVTEPKVAYEGLLSDLWDKKIDYGQFVNGVNDLRNQNTDWFDALMRTAFSQTHNMALSGGNDKMRYYASVSYANDQDAQRNTGTERYTANLNVDLQLAKKLKLSMGITGAISNSDRTHPSVDLMSYAFNTSRTIKAEDENGLYYYPAAVFDPGPAGEKQHIGYNIFNELDHTWQDERAHDLNMNLNLTYNITNDLTFNTVFGYGLSNTNMQSVADEQSFYISERRKVPYGVPIPEDPIFRNKMDIPYGGELQQMTTDQSTYNIRPTVLLNKMMNKHQIEAQVGMEVRSSHYYSLSKTEWGYLPDRGMQFVEIDLSQFGEYRKKVQQNRPRLRDNLNNTMSLFAIARYTWDNRYTANFNVRYDGSNNFGRDRSTRFLPVWSVSGRWNIANEPFLRDNTWIDALGLKASYGAQGNVVDGQTPYMVIRPGSFNTITNEYQSTLDSYPNPKLRWEKTMSWQVGVDFSFWEGRLSGSFEYYSKVGRDQVVTKILPLSTGVKSVIMNGGSLWNKGWDLGLSASLLSTKDWRWTATFNISRNTNRIENTESPGLNAYQNYLDGSVIINGMSLNSFYSYRFDGLDNNGLPTFRGLDLLHDDGTIASTYEDAIALSMVRSGQRDPKVSGGFTTGLRYRKLSFNMNLSFALGSKVRLNPLYKSSGQQLPLPQQNWSKEFVNRWQKPGDEAFTNIPSLSDKELRLAALGDQKFSIGDNYWQMYNMSSTRVVSGSYLRCTSMALNYSFGENVCKFIHAQGLSLGLTVGNVFLIADKQLNGQDPEMVGFGSRTLPPLRTYSLTLALNF